MISVLLVIDEPVTAAGLRAIFNEDPGFDIAAEDTQVSAAIKRLSSSPHPDVIVIDARELRDELFDCLSRLTKTHTDTLVLLIAPKSSDVILRRIVATGVRGYLAKPVSTALVTAATEALHRDAIVLSVDVGNQLLRDLYEPAGPNPLETLTHQEHRVLEQLAAGRSNDEIATSLNLSAATNKKHLSNLMHKTGTRDRLQAGLLGWRPGLGRTHRPQTPASSPSLPTQRTASSYR